MPHQNQTKEPGGISSPGVGELPQLEFGQVIVRATTNTHDLKHLTEPLLQALAQLGSFDTTYLVTFDWNRRQQTVRFVHSTEEVVITEGMSMAIPEEISPDTIAGVTRSPERMPKDTPDSLVAQRLGLSTYVSVPIVVAKHRLFGMLCGASLEPSEVGERVVSVMEFFAQIIADHVMRTEVAAAERRAEAAEEQLRTRARFLAMAEHELKTPLTALEGMSDTLHELWKDLTESDREDLIRGMVRNAQYLRRMVDDLLVEARADIQTRELMPVRLELEPFVETIAKAFGAASKHELIADVPADLTVWADPTPLYQLLGHLLDNAIKYSPGGTTITIKAAKTPSDEVVIDVSDEGEGLPEDVDVFAPFQQGTPRQKESSGGIGLGLHIVRSLVEAMNGRVTARRNTDVGSTFSVYLPRAS